MTVNQETLHAVSEAMLHEDAVSVSLPGTDWMVVRKSRYELLSSNSERAEAAEARIAELEGPLRLAATTFRYYAKLHFDKHTDDGDAKGEANQQIALEMESALTQTGNLK